MPQPRRAPSMRDVAQLAGVSHQTVSRVLNHPELVRPETRDSVRAVIERVGFHPNRAARALATASTRLIGVLSPEHVSFGPSRLITAIEDAAEAQGYAVAVGLVHGPSSARQARASLERLRGLGVDGLVVVATDHDALQLARDLSADLPLCVVTSAPDPGAMPSAGVDQHRGAIDTIALLATRGARRVVLVSGPPSWFDASERLRGWLEAAAASGMSATVAEAGWGAQEGRRAAEAALSEGVPDAFVCANDHAALGVLSALHARGIAPGREVMVTGFDDVVGSDHFWPPLTTVAQPFDEVGRRAIAALVAVLDSTDSPDAVRVPPRLLERDSTASWAGRMM